MAYSLNKPMFHIVLLLVLAMAVASCGRRGALELPGTTQNETTQGNILKPEGGANAPEQPVKEKIDKPFILDGLL